MAKGWYVVHTYSGYEQKIERIINKMRETDTDFALVCTDVKVPFETVVEVKDGVRRDVKRKILPGYILVELDLPDHSWKTWCSQIKRIQGVTGFVTPNDSVKPQPLNAAEVKSLFQKTGDLPAEKVFKPKQSFSIGEQVRIIEGPFDSFTGVIEEVNLEKARMRVSVGIFGRSTPVEVDFLQVEKIL
ncbi:MULTISPECIES: transcription termination/antitermination protein NusG [Sphaerochaeta]|jgi:transcriptional antiterminator NusG|uniref:Transcription termination/antitermination protein NusG n=2 Tax=root TaxID=1 RepID=A0ABY4D9I1_9SPIR|nr:MULTISPECIES: transcription termination/antitermination protein NusG [Sphaerochaeta]MDT3358790.1 transcription termination/antitermination protein NusG [Spirochaetota bacterium]HAP55039.1 transcription termination/antitermination factor NusG [Spirochaetaceae bacterium]MDD2394110.1 transcription termination/antitermination protein NusG [Sphaerochaeta sp.]MDD3423573.1 transcription termination/antitermination protein NusG [Sphaerochaeta sp.]MDD3456380.1 transcription termination/antiterminati